MTQAECEHGLPPGCPLHRRSRGRRALDVAVIVALWGLDIAVVVVVAWGMWRATTALLGGQP